MKKTFKSLIGFAFMAIFTLSLVSFNSILDTMDDWPVPDKYKSMKNPLAGEGDDDEIGADLYAQHCRSCHGKEGFGDGTKAGELTATLRELGGSDVQAQSDGTLYYKGIIGKDEMPNFEKKIRDEEDRWYLINYIRSLKE